MYVCLCRGITEQQIKTAVQGGAQTLADVRSGLGVSAQCGRCAFVAQQVIKEALTSLDDDLFYEAV